MKTVEDVKDYVIERGIVGCKVDERGKRCAGCIQGFELCRTLYTPEDFQKKLEELHKEEFALRDTPDIEDYWEVRYKTIQVEFVFERLKVAWGFLVLSASAVIDYAKIVGVKPDFSKRPPISL